MYERAHRHHPIEDHDEFEESEYQRSEELVRESCEISEEPPYELADYIQPNVAFTKQALHIRVPEGVGTWSWEHYFRSFGYSYMEMRYLDNEKFISRYLSSLDEENVLCDGSIVFKDSDTVVIEPGIRRTYRPEESKVAEGIYYFYANSHAWSGASPQATFYSNCIAPHFAKSTTNNPIDWAAERSAIGIGYAFAMIGKDLPPNFIISAFRGMAPIVCNSVPYELLKPREHKLNPHRKELLDRAHELFPRVMKPETALFLIENGAVIHVDDLRKLPIERFIRNLPRSLDNGLNIDRVSNLIDVHLKHGVDPKTGLFHAVTVVDRIYSRKDKPWWFKEDFCLDPENGKASAWAEQARMDAEQIAGIAGFAYQYAIKVFQQAGLRLADLSGIPREEAIKFSCGVTKDFGIGNVSRACNVLRYAEALLKEAPVTERPAVLNSFSKMLSRHRPQSEIIGVLEGSECNFEKPGLFSMVVSLLGEERAKEDKVDDVTIEPDHVKDLVREFSRPLRERAKVRPALAAPINEQRLLTCQFDTGALALPVAKEHPLAKSKEAPLVGWLAFDKQLHDECQSWEPDKIAKIYFTFCAAKLPDPFRPPGGFLRFLEKFEEIPIPEHRHTMFEAPHNRHAVAKQNEQHVINRYLIVSNLLDAYVMGLASWERLQSLFDWVTVPLGEAEEREIEIEVSWEQKWEDERYHAADSRYYFEELREVRDERYDAEERALWHRLKKGEKNTWVENSLKELVRKERVLLGLEKDKEEDLPECCDADGKVPSAEKIRKMREERLSDRARDSKRESQQGEQVTRLKRLELSLNGFAVINVLVGSEVLPVDSTVSIFSGLLDQCQTGELKLANSLQAFSEKPEELYLKLKEFAGLGFLDPEVIGKAVRSGEFLEGSLDLAEQIVSGVKACQRAKELLSHSLSSIARDLSYAQDIDQTISSERQRVEEELREVFSTSTLIASDAIERMMEQFYWVDRYAAVFPAVQAFQERKIEPKYGSTSHDTWQRESNPVGLANRTILSSWYLTQALNYYDSLDLKDKKEVQKHPQLTGEVQPPDETRSDLTVFAETRRTFQGAFERIEEKLDDAQKAILEARRRTFGLLPVGGKVHVLHKMDSNRLEFLKQKAGFGSTPFRLIHADTSLLLPPMPSSGELKEILKLLDREKVVDWDHPEIQISIGGRLRSIDCAVLGSAVLLSTQMGVEYDERSFYTNRDSSTGYRIMIYDAGGPRSEFPFSTDLGGHNARTDIQGRRHLDDIDRYQLLGTVLVHGRTNGVFKPFVGPFVRKYLNILTKYKLDSVLGESWINSEDRGATAHEGKRHFEKAIKPCTDAWFSCYENCTETGEFEGVVFEVQKLFDWLRNQVKVVQDQMLESDEFSEQKEILLSF